MWKQQITITCQAETEELLDHTVTVLERELDKAERVWPEPGIKIVRMPKENE